MAGEARAEPSNTLVGGRYRLVEVAGKGGMANVWRGECVGAAGFRRTVALKQMHEHLTGYPLYVDMFVEEARVGSRLQDGNIAQVYDLCCEEDSYYIVLEWVEGIDLGSYLRYYEDLGARTPWELACAVGIGMLRGLAAAHERHADDRKPCPIVHRDVSPTNVLLGANGTVKLIDFGLALTRDRVKDLTNPGIVKGKISYLAPEILAGHRPTPHSDQYAAGAVLWEALVGQKLFDGATDLEVYRKVREGLVRPLRPQRPDIPRDLVTVVQRSLSLRPQDRYQTVREMAHQLGVVLKSARLRKDLLELLARTVHAARDHFALGRRTRVKESTAPILELGDPERASGSLEHERALWRRLPFLGRR